jgi:hypothetical protein
MEKHLPIPTLMQIVNEILAEQSVVGMSPTTIPVTDNHSAEESRTEKDKEQNFYSKYMIVQIPYSEEFKNTTLALPIGTKFKVWKHPISPYDYSSDYRSWVGSGWEKFIPTTNELDSLFPDGTLRQFTTPDGTKYNTHLKRVSDPPNLKHVFVWYYDGEGRPYQQNIDPNEIPKSLTPEEKTWWDEWGLIIANVATSLVAAWLTGGASIMIQIAIQVGIDLTFAGIQLANGDKFGAGISAILAFIPLASKFLKIGEVSSKMLANIITKVKSCADVEALKTAYIGFSQAEKVAFRKIFSNQSEELMRATSKAFYLEIKEALTKKTLSLSKIPVTQRKSIREFFFNVMVTAGVFGGSLLYINREADRMAREFEAQGDFKLEKIDLGSEEDAERIMREFDKKFGSN